MLSRAAVLFASVAAVAAQSISIDWSQVEVDASGAATFGPRVVGLPAEDEGPPLINELLGYYSNSDGFYGREDFVEYQVVQLGEAGRIQALKIVGDRNVPRGQLS